MLRGQSGKDELDGGPEVDVIVGGTGNVTARDLAPDLDPVDRCPHRDARYRPGQRACTVQRSADRGPSRTHGRCDRALGVRAGTAVRPAPGTRPIRSVGARWGTLVVATLVAVGFAVIASFLALLHRGEFASGRRSPVVAAIFWGLAAALVASPVALLPLIGSRVRPATAVSWALGLGVMWFVVGYFVLD
jgi:hypothetical protein